MLEPTTLVTHVQAVWNSLPPGPVGKDALRTVILGFFFFCVVYSIERFYQAQTRYRSSTFRVDLFYWFYYRSGLHNILIFLLFLGAIEAHLLQLDSLLNFRLLEGLHPILQIALFWLLRDCAAYWIHRAQHHFKFLWAFHATHHTQTHLSFATVDRSHPLDVFPAVLIYVPIRILGATPETGLLISLMSGFVSAISHSQIPWTFGALYPVIVSPRFHSFHHSTSPLHYNKNFGVFFSFWDFIFGTALHKKTIAPVEFGLKDLHSNSLVDTLTTPVRILGLPSIFGQPK